MLFQSRRKLFCIGFNKTGTTSLAAALFSFGLRVGDQAQAELLLDDWARRDFRRIIAYCRGSYCLFADEAVTLLRERGFNAVRLEGGWPEWSVEHSRTQRKTAAR